MYENVLVEVCIPAAQQSFDMSIPVDIPSMIILELIEKLCEEISVDGFIFTRDTHIYCLNTDTILMGEDTYRKYAIKNGYKLFIL